MRTATGESGSDVDLSRIRELEERLDNLRIQVSEGMTVMGSAWQGYALNVPSCEPITTSDLVCPDVSDINITLSGVNVDCGCLPLVDLPEGGTLASSIYTNIAINDTFPITRDLIEFIPCYFFGASESVVVHLQQWFLPKPDCSGSPDAESDEGVTIEAQLKDGTWRVLVRSGNFAFFYGSGTNPSSISNTLVCADLQTILFPDDPSFFPFSIYGAAHGGTASITI